MKVATNSRKDRIRRLIKSSSTQCMSAQDLALRLDLDLVSVRYALDHMDDAYIVDWRKSPGATNAWRALYAVVDVPANAPMPSTYVAKSRSCRAPMAHYQEAEEAKPEEPYRPRTVWAPVGATHG